MLHYASRDSCAEFNELFLSLILAMWLKQVWRAQQIRTQATTSAQPLMPNIPVA